MVSNPRTLLVLPYMGSGPNSHIRGHCIVNGSGALQARLLKFVEVKLQNKHFTLTKIRGSSGDVAPGQLYVPDQILTIRPMSFTLFNLLNHRS